MRLLIIAQNGRSILNWAPLLSTVEAAGGKGAVALLSTAGLHDISWPEPLREQWIWAADDHSVIDDFMEAARAFRPDIILLATAVSGIELEVLSRFADQPRRPLIVAAQHGFFQNWERYRALECFDRFITFGPLFNVSDARFHIGALPKLDLIERHMPAPTRDRYLLAPQTIRSEAISPLVDGVHERLGLEVLLRPHPLALNLWDDLLERPYVSLDRRSDLNAVFRDVDFVVTMGSTIVLEALAAGLRPLVLPYQNGETYDQAGLMISDISAKSLMSALEIDWSGADDFLAAASGSTSANRTTIALSVLKGMLGDAGD